MQKISNTLELKNAIRQLENQRADDWILLKEEILTTVESLKPINIVKNSLKAVLASPELQTDAVNAALGLTTGYLAKKVLIGNTYNPFKNLIGYFVELAVADKTIHNAESIKSFVSIFVQKLFKK